MLFPICWCSFCGLLLIKHAANMGLLDHKTYRTTRPFDESSPLEICAVPTSISDTLLPAFVWITGLPFILPPLFDSIIQHLTTLFLSHLMLLQHQCLSSTLTVVSSRIYQRFHLPYV